MDFARAYVRDKLFVAYDELNSRRANVALLFRSVYFRSRDRKTIFEGFYFWTFYYYGRENKKLRQTTLYETVNIYDVRDIIVRIYYRKIDRSVEKDSR